MKVLHIGKYYFPFFGGIEKVTQDLVECDLYQQKVTSCILVHHHTVGEKTLNEKINNIDVCKVAILGVVAFAPIAPSFLKELNRLIDEFKPDLIHIHMPNLSAFACLFSKRAKQIPWIIHWHSDVVGAVPDLKIKLLYPFYRFFEKRMLQHSKRILVTSPPYLEYSAPLSEVKSKCEVIPIGIKGLVADKLSCSRSSQLNLLMIGRLTYYKGHSLILKAIANLPKNMDIHLSIIGNGELKEQLIKQTHDLGINKKVCFLGTVSDDEITEQITNMDLLCLPSIEKTEAFGVVLLEAAKNGKPALVSDVKGSGMSWVVQDNVTGYVVKNNSEESLIKKLIEIYNEREKLVILGNNAKLRFDEVFSLDKISVQLTALYSEIVTDKAGLARQYHLD